MHQYTYRATSPQGTSHTIHCTAARPEWARVQIAETYSGWSVSAEPLEIGAPHRIYGEIDASNMTADDYEWLLHFQKFPFNP